MRGSLEWYLLGVLSTSDRSKYLPDVDFYVVWDKMIYYICGEPHAHKRGRPRLVDSRWEELVAVFYCFKKG